MLYFIKVFYYQFMHFTESMMTTSLTNNIEIENAILDKFFTLCYQIKQKPNTESIDLLLSQISKIRDFQLDLEKANTTYGLNIQVFSGNYNKIIFNYLVDSTNIGSFVDASDIQQALVKRFPHDREAIKNIFHGILGGFSYDFTLKALSIVELVDKLLLQIKPELLKKSLAQISTNNDIAAIKNLLDEYEDLGTSTKQKLEKQAEKYRKSIDPLEKVEIKKSIRLLGFTSNEVSDVTDNFTTPQKQPELVKALDFLNKKFSDSNWIFPGLLKAGVVNLICGQGGSGKTAFCYDALASFLSQSEFIGEKPSILAKSSNRGLIINQDQPGRDAQEMLRNNQQIWKLAKADKIEIIDGNWTLLNILQLETYIASGVFNIIVIDSYKAIHEHLPDWDENSASASLGLKELQKICDRYGVTMLVIHHAGNTSEKGRHKSRGHSSIADTASSVLSLTSSQINGTSDPNIRFLEISKLRGAERCNLTLKFNPLNFKYELLPDTTGLQRLNTSKFADILMTEFRLNSHRSLGKQDLIKKIHSTQESKESLLNRAINKLEQRGEIIREVDEYTNDFLYRILPTVTTTDLKADLAQFTEKLNAIADEDF